MPGQKILLLLLPNIAKLFYQWQGPFDVIRKVGPIDYEIWLPDRWWLSQIFHVNLLKEWHDNEALFGWWRSQSWVWRQLVH